MEKSCPSPSWKNTKGGSILLQEIISPGSDKAFIATSSCVFISIAFTTEPKLPDDIFPMN